MSNINVIIFGRIQITNSIYKRRMSVTVSNCDEICQSPTNTSLSKMLYTFPKTSRFTSRNIILCDKYYDIPSTLNSCRSTSQGFGHKYDFTQDAPRNPSPNTYNIKSHFSTNKTTGFGFGKGREEMYVTGPLANVRLNKNPGPGSYPINSTLTMICYSMNGKPHEEDKERQQIPGPGYYPVTFCINEKGTYFLSKYKSSCVRNFSQLEGKELHLGTKVPGPGAYDTNNIGISPKGRYAVSKMKNCLTGKFAITTRKPLVEKNTNPGPGNYKLPSEFGHYVARSVVQKSIVRQKEKTVDTQLKEN